MPKKKHDAQGHYQSTQEVETDDNDYGMEDEDEDEGEVEQTVRQRVRTKRPARVSKFAGKGRKITVPMLKLNAGDCLAIKFTGETRTQKMGKDDKPAALLYRVIDMDSGEISDLIGTKVLISTLEREFPDGFADKQLLLECAQRPDKKYLDVLISELE